MSEKLKCSKDDRCQDCQNWLKENLAKCEDWEVKRKESYQKFEFRFCSNQSEGNSKVDYSETGGYNYNWEKCPSCQAVIKIIKSNSHGDKTEELKEHAHASNCQASNQIKSNQIKSNQIKSNQIKSNQIKSNQISDTSSSQSSNKINYLLWILGGIGVVGLVGVLVYFLTRKENK